jgi:hypothetical protein
MKVMEKGWSAFGVLGTIVTAHAGFNAIAAPTRMINSANVTCLQTNTMLPKTWAQRIIKRIIAVGLPNFGISARLVANFSEIVICSLPRRLNSKKNQHLKVTSENAENQLSNHNVTISRIQKKECTP